MRVKMKIVKPKKLKKGDVIGFISPASSPEDLTRIQKAVRYAEKLGYRAEVGKNVGKYNGYLAGTDDERLEDFHSMFSNKKIKAIVCLRGGYGAPRLLHRINYDLIKDNPKIFVGYSDITALQMAILSKTGLVTIAGQMAAVEFFKKMPAYSEEYFWQMLTSTKKIGKVELPGKSKLRTMSDGVAEGTLIGGNLAVFVGLMGSEYCPSFDNSMLFFEDVGEVPYRIDRFFSQLRLAKAFEKTKGFILGQFSDCEEKDETKRTLPLESVFDDYFSGIKLPVVSNFPHGHVPIKIPLAFGTKVKVNAIKAEVEFMESAVI